MILLPSLNQPLNINYRLSLLPLFSQFANAMTGTIVVEAPSTGICFVKRVVFEESRVANNDVWVALSFFIGLLFVLAIFFVILGVCYWRRRQLWMRPKSGRIAPAALIATAVMGRVSEDVII